MQPPITLCSFSSHSRHPISLSSLPVHVRTAPPFPRAFLFLLHVSSPCDTTTTVDHPQPPPSSLRHRSDHRCQPPNGLEKPRSPLLCFGFSGLFKPLQPPPPLLTAIHHHAVLPLTSRPRTTVSHRRGSRWTAPRTALAPKPLFQSEPLLLFSLLFAAGRVSSGHRRPPPTTSYVHRQPHEAPPPSEPPNSPKTQIPALFPLCFCPLQQPLFCRCSTSFWPPRATTGHPQPSPTSPKSTTMSHQP